MNLNDPLRRPEPGAGLGGQVREVTSWLVDVLFERVDERPAPEPPVELKACRLRAGRRIGCVSLVGGCGTTTIAALLAQRSGGAGGRVRLIDLDLATPTIALLAGQRTPTLLDALAEESVRGRRWGSVDAIFGADRDPGPDVAESLARFVRRMSTDAAVVVDAGTLAATACEAVLHACDTVVYVTTPRAAHVHAAVRAAAALDAIGVDARLVVARSAPDVAGAVAREVGLALLGSIPEDPFLARDEFRVRAETARAIDRVCAALA